MGTYWAGVRGGQHLTAVGYGLLLVGPVALVGRRRWPAAVLVVTVASTVAYYALRYPYGPVFLAMVVAVLAAMTAGYRVLAWACTMAALAVYLVLSRWVTGAWGGWTWATGHIEAVIAIVGLAELLRIHAQRMVRRRRARAEAERRQASEERLRIAQELHDVLAHHISLINVQAGVALHLIDQKPEQVRTALAAIKQASKDALGEMRSALAVLRGDEAAPRQPTSGLDRLPDLLDRMAEAGLPVDATVSGERRSLPVEVDLAAFRIVQEALTNVYRHGRATRVGVELTYRADHLGVDVVDDGTGKPSDLGGGNGIAGMRQRAASLGGNLTAGPRPGGGWRVSAWIPLSEDGRVESGGTAGRPSSDTEKGARPAGVRGAVDGGDGA